MMTSLQTTLLSELLRPQSLGELTLPDRTIRSLQKMADSGSIMNLLFYGRPGIGKTSAAKILVKETGADSTELNGSFNEGDKTMVNNIKSFATSVSLTGKPKICFIDEADFMPRSVQDPLRYIIEQVSNNTRFLLTANDVNRLTPAMRSRCVCINFDIPRKDSTEVIDKMIARFEQKLQKLEIEFDSARLREIVHIYFPDFRAIVNKIEFEPD